MQKIAPRFLETPVAFLTAVAVAIFAFGLGLTSPIWFLLTGEGPVEAMRSGTPIVDCAIVGLIVTTLVGVLAYRLKKPGEEIVEASTAPTPDAERWKHRIVHLLVVLMFVIPFLTIIVGVLLKQVIDADAG